MEEIIAFLQKNQKELSEKYTELEDLQGEMPNAYGIRQDGLQRIDEANEHYRIAIYNLELAMGLEKKVV